MLDVLLGYHVKLGRIVMFYLNVYILGLLLNRRETHPLIRWGKKIKVINTKY